MPFDFYDKHATYMFSSIYDFEISYRCPCVPVSIDMSMKIVSLAEKIIEPPNCYQVEVTTMDGDRM